MVGFPIDYGDNLTPEQAFKNFKGHSKEVAITLAWMMILGTASAYAEDRLLGSLKSKSSPSLGPPSGGGGSCPAPTTLGIPRPQTPVQRALNTGAIGVSIGVLCLNAMWVPSPIAEEEHQEHQDLNKQQDDINNHIIEDDINPIIEDDFLERVWNNLDE